MDRNDVGERHKNILEINLSVGDFHSGLASKQRDDRTKRIELIRRTETKPVNLELSSIQKKSIAIFNSRSTARKKSGSNYDSFRDRLRKSLNSKSIPKLLTHHSLKSINGAVIMKYGDRPYKLRDHLPFAVDYQNAAVYSDLNNDPIKVLPEAEQQSVYAENILQLEDRMKTDLPFIGPEEQAQDCYHVYNHAKQPSVPKLKRPNHALEIASSNHEDSSVISSKNFQVLPPEEVTYREENLMGLRLQGKNVYDSERKAYLNVINELLVEL